MSEAPGRPLVSRFLAAAIIASVIAAVFLALSFARWREIGWGGRAWLVAFIVMIVIRAPFTLRHLANTVVSAHGGRVDLTLLAAMAVSGVALPLLFLSGADLTFADYDSPVWTIALGAVIAVPALWLHWRAHADLGQNWSPSLELREGHSLVTRGVYRYIRHPMYAGLWLWSIAQLLLLHNWIAGALIVPVFAALYFVRVPREERMLREYFGVAYDRYAARTGRLLPKLEAF